MILTKKTQIAKYRAKPEEIVDVKLFLFCFHYYCCFSLVSTTVCFHWELACVYRKDLIPANNMPKIFLLCSCLLPVVKKSVRLSEMKKMRWTPTQSSTFAFVSQEIIFLHVINFSRNVTKCRCNITKEIYSAYIPAH